MAVTDRADTFKADTTFPALLTISLRLVLGDATAAIAPSGDAAHAAVRLLKPPNPGRCS